MPNHTLGFPPLADVAEKLRLDLDQRLALFTGTWTCEELPPIESERQYEAYAAEEARMRAEHWDGCKETFGDYSRSNPGRYAATLASRMIEWEMRLAGGHE
jgi:hypothetical protein